tara:strand:- start:124 stop:1146 length:1023 start_codon:yes stop_codon:yes gene_type:complete
MSSIFFLDNLKFTNKELKKLKNKKILITGASGFIGKSLFYFLSNISDIYKLNIKFILISRRKFILKKKFLHNTKYFNLDIKDINKFNEKSDIVFHLASKVEHPPSKKIINESFETVVMGTSSIIKYCINFKIKKIIYFSSAALYSSNQKLKNININEAHEKYFDLDDKNNYYAIHKKIAEDIIINNLNRKEYAIIRPFTIIGPGMKLEHSFVFGNFIKNILQSNDIIIKSDGLTKRSFLHVNDLSYFSVKILLSAKKNIYNVGSNKVITIKKLANLFKTIYEKNNQNKKLKVKILNQIKNNRRKYYKPDSNLFFNEFKLIENYDLNEKIRDTYTWFLKNG